jgi:hypothetical protein
MENIVVEGLCFDDLSEDFGLEVQVKGHAAEILENGLIPLEPYESHVHRICDCLRSWCRTRIDFDANEIVDHLAKAYVRYIMAYKHLEDPEKYMDLVYYDVFNDGAEYETFTECLLADICKEWQRMNHGLVGLREFLKRKA